MGYPEVAHTRRGFVLRGAPLANGQDFPDPPKGLFPGLVQEADPNSTCPCPPVILLLWIQLFIYLWHWYIPASSCPNDFPFIH